jgi:hypothetical protein
MCATVCWRRRVGGVVVLGSLNECGWWFFIGGIVGGGTVHGPGRQFNQWNWGEITVFEGRLARVLSGCSQMSLLVGGSRSHYNSSKSPGTDTHNHHD